MKKMKAFISLLVSIFIVLFAIPVFSVPITIDGSGFSTGINSGFGDVIGESSILTADSTSSGDLSFTLTRGVGNLNDVMVIYIDADNGTTGITNTSVLTDISDNGRSAISGSSSSNSSDLEFAFGFAANYAITLESTFSGLYAIGNDPTNHNFQRDLGTAFNDPLYEMTLTMGDLGLSAGDSFRYVATYLNSSNTWRSNEFHGVSAATVGSDNIGLNPFSLAEGDFNTFRSASTVPEPSTIILLGSSLAGLILFRRRLS